MKKFIFLAISLIIYSSCTIVEPIPLVSKDFEGKFIIEASDVYIADQDGLTQVPVFDSAWIWHDDFEWIRDGQFIYYHEVHSSGWIGLDLITPKVLAPDGALVHDFESDFGRVSQADISPAGNRLAVSRYPYYVYVYDLNQDFNPILIDSVVASPESSIAWAPDGEQFLFELARDTSVDFYVQASGIAVYNMKTRSVIPVFDYAGQPYGFGSPGWSADGSRFSFIRDSTLFIGDAKGLGTYPVSVETLKVQIAAWSTTEDELAYIRWWPDKDSTEIVIYDPNSATRTPLSATASSNYKWNEKFQLKWSKDGYSIAFIGIGMYYRDALFIINRDGTNIRRIYEDIVSEFDWYEE